MIPLNAYQKLRQRYLVNENNPVGWFWLCLCRGWFRLPRPGSGRRRQPGTCRWQRQPEPASMGHCRILQLGSPSVPVVGAALIKSTLAIVQNKKSSTCFFPKTVARGPETTPRQVADTSPLLTDFVDLTLTKDDPPWHFMCVIVTSCLQFWLHSRTGATLPRATVKPESRVSGSPW